jgi:hypothetical protein
VEGSEAVALVPFAAVDLSALRWLRTGETPAAFALSSGDQTIAEMRWAKSTGSLARVQTADRQWTMKRVGFLNAHLTLRAEGGTTDLARVTVHYDRLSRHAGENYHRIEFADGARFRFRRAGVQLPAWQVTAEESASPAPTDAPSPTDALAELAHVEPVREGRKLVGGAVIVSEAGRARPQLPAVLSLVWYAIVLAWFEDELLLPFEEMGIGLPARD